MKNYGNRCKNEWFDRFGVTGRHTWQPLVLGPEFAYGMLPSLLEMTPNSGEMRHETYHRE